MRKPFVFCPAHAAREASAHKKGPRFRPLDQNASRTCPSFCRRTGDAGGERGAPGSKVADCLDENDGHVKGRRGWERGLKGEGPRRRPANCAIIPVPHRIRNGAPCGLRPVCFFRCCFSSPARGAPRPTTFPTSLAQCAACHGVDGIAKSADVPHLAGQHELYLFNQIKAFKTGRRAHKEMRYMSRQMSEAEMRDIARHYATMPR